MDISRLNLQDIEKLNKMQKYFYEHSQLFVQKLDCKYFDLNKTFYKIDKAKKQWYLELRLTTKKSSGIDVAVYVNINEAIVYLDGWHENINYMSNSVEEFYDSLERLLLFGLSKCCKIIIYKSNNRPYRWNLYSFENDKWKFYSTTGLIVYNFFGKKTQEEKQSTIFDSAIYPKELFSK